MRPTTTLSIFATKDSYAFQIPTHRGEGLAESRIVLTFDLDFGDILAIARSEAPSVVIFRLRNQTPAAVNARLFRVINDCAEELARGVLVIVEDEGFRVRRLPIRP